LLIPYVLIVSLALTFSILVGSVFGTYPAIRAAGWIPSRRCVPSVMPYIEEAFRVLWANKIRTLLTMLGLIIGVGAVIAIQVLGTAWPRRGRGPGTLTDNSFVVFPSSTQRDVTSAAIRLRDLPPLRTLPGVVDAMPLGFSTELIRAGHAHGRFGISPDSSISFQNLPIRYGRHISDDDVAGAANVALSQIRHFNDCSRRRRSDRREHLRRAKSLRDRRRATTSQARNSQRAIQRRRHDSVHDVRQRVRSRLQRDRRGHHLGTPPTFRRSKSPCRTTARTPRNPQGLEYQTFDKAKFSQGIGGIFNALTIVVALIGAVALLVAGIALRTSCSSRLPNARARSASARRSGRAAASAAAVLHRGFADVLDRCAIGLVIGLSIGAFVNDVFIVKITGTSSRFRGFKRY